MKPRNAWFTRFAKGAARATGHPLSFFLAIAIIILWAFTGPLFKFSDTWQLVINTSTTIVTFLMVFMIQNTQNRDTAAIQVKLDELIRAIDGAQNVMLNLEELDDEELEKIRKNYLNLATEALKDFRNGSRDLKPQSSFNPKR
jgi:low affinity Fe/Cu permease